jgi:Replication initiator protein A
MRAVPRPARQQQTNLFSWIDQWVDLTDSQTKESKGLSLTLSDWFYRSVR